jgi:hypothetical protein
MKLFNIFSFILIFFFLVSCSLSNQAKEKECILGVYVNSVCCEKVCDKYCENGFKPNTCNCECLDYNLDIFYEDETIIPPSVPF